MNDLDPHPPRYNCNCGKCLASRDDTSLVPDNLTAVTAQLIEDGGMLVDAHPDVANNMAAAAMLIDLLFERLTSAKELGVVDFLPQAERGALEKMYQAMARKLYAKYQEGTSGFETASAEHLSRLLRRHVDKGDPVDVANFCAFLLFNGDRIESVPTSAAMGAHSFSPPTPAPARPVDRESVAVPCDLLQRQPPKGWGIYLAPDAPGEILISKPNGDGVRVRPDSDPLLYELAEAMLPPPAPEIQL